MGRPVVALAFVATVTFTCGTGEAASVCSLLDDVSVSAGSLAPDAEEVVARLTRVEPLLDEAQAADVRAVRDGLARVLAIVARHPDTPDLSALPRDARAEVSDTLRSISWPALRIEEYRRIECAAATR